MLKYLQKCNVIGNISGKRHITQYSAANVSNYGAICAGVGHFEFSPIKSFPQLYHLTFFVIHNTNTKPNQLQLASYKFVHRPAKIWANFGSLIAKATCQRTGLTGHTIDNIYTKSWHDDNNNVVTIVVNKNGCCNNVIIIIMTSKQCSLPAVIRLGPHSRTSCDIS